MNVADRLEGMWLEMRVEDPDYNVHDAVVRFVEEAVGNMKERCVAVARAEAENWSGKGYRHASDVCCIVAEKIKGLL